MPTALLPSILTDLDRLEEIMETVELGRLPDHFNTMGHTTPIQDLRALAALIELTRNCDISIPLTYLEIGTWMGITAITAASRPNVEVHCVDHWNGSAGPEGVVHRENIANCDDPENAFGIFNKNTKGYNITPHRGNSLDWAKKGIGKQVDVLFIDADHREEQVSLDLKAWEPHVRPGGIFCGHDYNFTGVNRAVKRFGFDASIWGAVWFKRIRQLKLQAT